MIKHDLHQLYISCTFLDCYCTANLLYAYPQIWEVSVLGKVPYI
jgi:hypothetical protein